MLDRALMSTFYRLHHSWLVGRLTRLTGNSILAEDLASEVFYRLGTIKHSPEIRSPRAFLTTIARRLIVDLRRRESLEYSYVQAIAQLPEADIPSAEDHSISIETLRIIENLLESMSSKAKAAFIYHRIDGISHTEIADRLSVSISSVRKYIEKADRIFQEYYK